MGTNSWLSNGVQSFSEVAILWLEVEMQSPFLCHTQAELNRARELFHAQEDEVGMLGQQSGKSV